MISPKVGSLVLFHPFAAVERGADYQPHAAIVTFVHSDRLVNLAVFNSGGGSYGREAVSLLQDDDQPPRGKTPFADWIPEEGTAGDVRPGWIDTRPAPAAGETAAQRDARLRDRGPNGPADDGRYSADKAPADSAWAQSRADRLGGQGRAASEFGADADARRAAISGGAPKEPDTLARASADRLKAEAEDTAPRSGETVEQRDARVAAAKTAAGL